MPEAPWVLLQAPLASQQTACSTLRAAVARPPDSCCWSQRCHLESNHARAWSLDGCCW